MKAKYVDVPHAQLPHAFKMPPEFWEAERRNRPVDVNPVPFTEGIDLDPYACGTCRPVFVVTGVTPMPGYVNVVACPCVLVFGLEEYETQIEAIEAPQMA